MDDESKRTILVVEDVEEISSQMQTMLHEKGHRVLQASNAQDALQIAEKDRPTIILTDLDLPTLGLLVQLIKGHQDLKDMPVAIIDINDPAVSTRNGLKVLVDFDQLDQLLSSTPAR
jgi:CheY-like chemotaxis protein